MDILSLLRIINLDMRVAVDTYVDSYAQQLEESIERRTRLAREVEADVRGPIAGNSTTRARRSRTAPGDQRATESQATGVTRAAGELNDVNAAVGGRERRR